MATDGSPLHIRGACREDVPDIARLLADDALGKTRETAAAGELDAYFAAFEEIARDPRNQLMVAERDGRIVGTYQVTYIPYLSRGGNERALIEAVRVASGQRGRGIGREMMEFALDEARSRGCLMAQLTTDRQREDAHRFYVALGFTPSHVGMKLPL